jgi:multimeric flavodoxin WrbA
LEKVLVLDGTAAGDEAAWPVLDALVGELERTGAEVRIFSLRDMELAHCIGDFGCWLETPGTCIYNEPHFRELLQTVIRSDTTILFTPVVFGGYSSQLKQFVDRFVSLVLPYFESVHGEMHHKPRYSHYPRLVGAGVQRCRNEKEAEVFRLLVGRNAINFHAPSYAAEVVNVGDDPDGLRTTFRALLLRKDRFPFGESISSLVPTTGEVGDGSVRIGQRHACLVVGSPKTKSPSTSGVLGNRVLERLRKAGWETESLTLGPSIQMERGQSELLAAVDRSDLLLFAFPLYIDSLPFLMTKALELIAAHQSGRDGARLRGLFVIANNGFVESYQNYVAISICRMFAEDSGMTWMGALAMGAGEALVGGEPLESQVSTHRGLPRDYLIHALDTAGDALARGLAVPPEAVTEIAKSPISHVPNAIWRLLFTMNGGKMWEEQAAENEVSKQELLARPYA